MSKADLTYTQARIPKPVYEEMRKIAFEQRISINSILCEGAALVLQRYGISTQPLPNTKETMPAVAAEKMAPSAQTLEG